MLPDFSNRTDVDHKSDISNRTDVGHKSDIISKSDVGHKSDISNRTDVCYKSDMNVSRPRRNKGETRSWKSWNRKGEVCFPTETTDTSPPPPPPPSLLLPGPWPHALSLTALQNAAVKCSAFDACHNVSLPSELRWRFAYKH